MRELLTKAWEGFSVFYVIALLLLGFLLLGTRPVWQSLSARSWVSVNCRITHSDMVTVQRRNRTLPDYRFDVGYQYEFAGQSHTSRRYAFGMASQNPMTVFNLKQRYPTGAETTCFVNPSRPHEAVLDRSLDFASILYTLAFGGVLGLIFFLWRKRRAKLAQTV